jgi:hypothetical protein
MTAFDTFATIYREELQKAVDKYPDQYLIGQPLVIHGNTGSTTLPASTVSQVADRMLSYVKAGGRGYSKEGHAFKGTCKRLGIKHTYTAIETYLKGGTA